MAGSTLSLSNLTAHVVRVLDESGEELGRWQPSGVVARLEEVVGVEPDLVTDLGPIGCRKVGYRDRLEGLPDAVPGCGFIVSRIVAAAIDRDDLFFPFPELRDAAGTIIGCGGLARFDHGQAR